MSSEPFKIVDFMEQQSMTKLANAAYPFWLALKALFIFCRMIHKHDFQMNWLLLDVPCYIVNAPFSRQSPLAF